MKMSLPVLEKTKNLKEKMYNKIVKSVYWTGGLSMLGLSVLAILPPINAILCGSLALYAFSYLIVFPAVSRLILTKIVLR